MDKSGSGESACWTSLMFWTSEDSLVESRKSPVKYLMRASGREMSREEPVSELRSRERDLLFLSFIFISFTNNYPVYLLLNLIQQL